MYVIVGRSHSVVAGLIVSFMFVVVALFVGSSVLDPSVTSTNPHSLFWVVSTSLLVGLLAAGEVS